MKDKVISLIQDKIDHLNVVIDDAYIEMEGNLKFFRIVLDREKIMNVEDVHEVSQIINPIIDDANLVDDEYILDIYAKSKGDING